ncbi:DUF882 domain-containing protein [Faunimonas sp. B44]|uniref:DUF882 domain-containing protein n=1 Tax=Faunimonas sp. B44 TaxID=3461493 RepID=UPI0040439E55
MASRPSAGLRARIAVGTLCVLILASLSGYAAAREGDRTIKLYYTHTGEKGEFTFKRNGRYDRAELERLNRFLRDWRRGEPTRMDPQLFDLIWSVYQRLGTNQYIHVVSAYRSPATNSMLRSRSRGVAKNSQHTQGRAMDFFIPGVPSSKIRELALRMQVGGVGYYPTSASKFVHLDTGSVRHWPRMTRQQLLALFPTGETMYIPSDGKPLPGFERALAKYGKSKSTALAYLDAKASGGSSGGTLAGWLGRVFSGGADEEEDTEISRQPSRGVPVRTAPSEEPRVLVASAPARQQAPAAARVQQPTAQVPQVAVAEAATAPLPKAVPVKTRDIVLASLTPAAAPVPADLPQQPAALAAAAPAEAPDAAAVLAYAPTPKGRPGVSAGQPAPIPAAEANQVAALIGNAVPASERFEVASLPSADDSAALDAVLKAAQGLRTGAPDRPVIEASSAVAAASALGGRSPFQMPVAHPGYQLAYAAAVELEADQVAHPTPRMRPALKEPSTTGAVSPVLAVTVAAEPTNAGRAQTVAHLADPAPVRSPAADAAPEHVSAVRSLMASATTRTRAFAQFAMPKPVARSGLFAVPASASGVLGGASAGSLRTDRFSGASLDTSESGSASSTAHFASLR